MLRGARSELCRSSLMSVDEKGPNGSESVPDTPSIRVRLLVRSTVAELAHEAAAAKGSAGEDAVRARLLELLREHFSLMTAPDLVWVYRQIVER